MNASNTDVSIMLDELGLPESLRWKEIQESPEFSGFTPRQLLHEVIEPKYIWGIICQVSEQHN